MALNARQVEQVVGHLRAIRKAIEPAPDEDLRYGIRLLTAQGFIDATIALVLPAQEMPSLEPTVRLDGLGGRPIEVLDRFDPKV